MNNTPQAQIAELSLKLKKASEAYYTGDLAPMTDKEFDMAMKELEALEAAHPDLLLPDSPTQRVGSDMVAGFDKATHEIPMLSIANSYSMDEVGNFMKSVQSELGEPVQFSWELKVDGVSLTVKYKDGKLRQGITRGDGHTGDDVTESTRTIADIPMVIEDTGVVEVRGECYMEKAQFEKITDYQASHNMKVFTSPRSATSGSLKTKNVKEVARRCLRFRAFGLASVSPTVQNHFDAVSYIEALGFKSVNKALPVNSLEDFSLKAAQICEAREKLPFGIDGIVLKVVDLKQRERLGATGKVIRWATAYKFDSEQARTRVLKVTLQTGRTGKVVPVAELEPVLLMDSTVKRATLHNFDEIGRLGLRVGDTVFLEKGGDIIPKIVGIDESMRETDSKPIEIPEVCPECGAPLEKREGMLVDMFCSNTSGCPAQFLNSLTHFVARDCMNIMDLGESMLEKLVENDALHDIMDIYSLAPVHFMGIQGAGPKVVGKILDNIDASKNASPARLLTAVGVSRIGKGTSLKMMNHFGGWIRLWKAEMEEIAGIPEVGLVAAQSFCAWRQSHPDFLSKITNMEFKLDQQVLEVKAGGPLAGEVAVVTGSFPTMSREDMESLLRDNGARVTGSVSKKTTLLVLGAEPGSKLQKAEDLGIKIWSEAMLMERLDS